MEYNIRDLKDLEKVNLTYKGIRQLNIIYNNTEYTIDIIGYSNKKGNIRTEFWIGDKHNILKIVAGGYNRELSDDECRKYIKEKLEHWIGCYNTYI